MSFWVIAAMLFLFDVAVCQTGLPQSNFSIGQWHNAKDDWTLSTLNRSQLINVVESVSLHRLYYMILPYVMIVRPPGSPGSLYVRQVITSIMKNSLGWTIEEDRFSDKPPYPYPTTTFTNIIATQNPLAKRRLILACHYDSKVTPKNFVGATDSAVPCSMIIEIAIALRNIINASTYYNDITLQLIFFDGEEAFVKWSDSDSLYGSRHLAEKWQNEVWPSEDKNSKRNRLDSIDLLVLLDLLGAPNPRFYNNRIVRSKYFTELIAIEKTLYGKNIYFREFILGRHVEDDHIPFHRRNVPVLHVITTPYPRYWHTLNDNFAGLDTDVIKRLTNIFAVFVARYLHLEVPQGDESN